MKDRGKTALSKNVAQIIKCNLLRLSACNNILVLLEKGRVKIDTMFKEHWMYKLAEVVRHSI